MIINWEKVKEAIKANINYVVEYTIRDSKKRINIVGKEVYVLLSKAEDEKCNIAKLTVMDGSNNILLDYTVETKCSNKFGIKDVSSQKPGNLIKSWNNKKENLRMIQLDMLIKEIEWNARQ